MPMILPAKSFRSAVPCAGRREHLAIPAVGHGEVDVGEALAGDVGVAERKMYLTRLHPTDPGLVSDRTKHHIDLAAEIGFQTGGDGAGNVGVKKPEGTSSSFSGSRTVLLPGRCR